MYIYLARNKGWLDYEIEVYGNTPIKDSIGEVVSYDTKFILDTLGILTPEDKPVPMLLNLGRVRLPGYLCYTCDGFMDFKYETVQRILGYEHSLRSAKVSIPILKPGQCKRISIKV